MKLPLSVFQHLLKVPFQLKGFVSMDLILKNYQENEWALTRWYIRNTNNVQISPIEIQFQSSDKNTQHSLRFDDKNKTFKNEHTLFFQNIYFWMIVLSRKLKIKSWIGILCFKKQSLDTLPERFTCHEVKLTKDRKAIHILLSKFWRIWRHKKYQLHLSSAAHDTQSKIHQEKRRGNHFLPTASRHVSV